MESLFSKQVLDFILTLISSQGLPWVILLGVVVYLMFISYKYLKARVFIQKNCNDTESESPITFKLNEMCSHCKNNNQVILEVLSKILEKQEASLTEEQARIILNYIIENIIVQMLSKIMETYYRNNFTNNEISIICNLRSEIEAIIKTNDRIIESLPNISELLVPTDNKITFIDTVYDRLVEICKTEKKEKEAYNRFKSVITTTIKNNWIY